MILIDQGTGEETIVQLIPHTLNQTVKIVVGEQDLMIAADMKDAQGTIEQLITQGDFIKKEEM